MFINEKCENLILVNDGGVLTRNTDGVLQYPINVHSVVDFVGKSISSITMWSIVIHLGKDDFSCGSLVSNLKESL